MKQPADAAFTRVRYDVTLDDLVAGAMHMSAAVRARTLAVTRGAHVVAGGAIGSVIVWGAMSRAGGGPSAIGGAVIVGALFAVGWLVYAVLTLRKAAFDAKFARKYRESHARGELGTIVNPNEVAIEEDGLVMADSDTVTQVAWRAIAAVERGPGHIFVRFRSGTVAFVPRRAFTLEGDAEVFASEIERRRDSAG